jgi:hypothetical protein
MQPDSDIFRSALLTRFDDLLRQVQTSDGQWTVKGFLDAYQRIYTISLDTKVLSKVLELLLFPIVADFAREEGFDIHLAQAQNHYPDITFINQRSPELCYPLDIKSTYRTGLDAQGNLRVNGMTLGTFGGYFRVRNRPFGSTLAYEQYHKHYVLGIIYNRVEGIDERRVYEIADLNAIPSVARDFTIILHEKYKIASDQPGSGNTRNMGSSRLLQRLVDGTGVFAHLGIDIFDDYWMNYQTKAMAQAAGFENPPYRNLISYFAYKKKSTGILNIPEHLISTESDDENDTSRQ